MGLRAAAIAPTAIAVASSSAGCHSHTGKGKRLVAIRIQRELVWDISMHHSEYSLLNPQEA